ncbi:MAG: hypothetical protein ACRD10_04020, partial [Terriglobia bacterium]
MEVDPGVDLGSVACPRFVCMAGAGMIYNEHYRTSRVEPRKRPQNESILETTTHELESIRG